MKQIVLKVILGVGVLISSTCRKVFKNGHNLLKIKGIMISKQMAKIQFPEIHFDV